MVVNLSQHRRVNDTKNVQTFFPKYSQQMSQTPVKVIYIRHLFEVHSLTWVLPFGVCFNTFKPKQNGRHFTDDILKYIFLNENV